MMYFNVMEWGNYGVLFLIDHKNFYSFILAKTHCETGYNCWPYTGSSPVTLANKSKALPADRYGPTIINQIAFIQVYELNSNCVRFYCQNIAWFF